jgi:hypothetical protein
MQETDFEYEFIIGEDDSSDGTREIVKSYKEEYPERIRLLLNSREDVIYIDGRPTGRWNFANNIKHARGQYIALLEGDDYWTASDKLKAQASFLDTHPTCAMCFHAVKKKHEKEGKIQISGQALTKGIYTVEDLLERNFITTCSVMFRSGLINGFPDWYYSVPMGDWPLHILNAQHGDIGYIDRAMAVYRIHRGGIRSLRSKQYKLEANIATLKTMREHLDSRYRDIIDIGIARRHLNVLRILLQEEGLKTAYSYLSALLEDQSISNRSLSKAALVTISRKLGMNI